MINDPHASLVRLADNEHDPLPRCPKCGRVPSLNEFRGGGVQLVCVHCGLAPGDAARGLRAAEQAWRVVVTEALRAQEAKHE